MAHPARNATVNPLLETPPSWSLDLSQHGAAEKCHFWERCDRGRSGVIYKWGGTDGLRRCLGVQGHRLPIRGVGLDTTLQASTRVLPT